MLRSLKAHSTKLVSNVILVTLVGLLCFDSALANNPPARCAGYGNLQSISLYDWESGLGSWTAGTHDVLNALTFNTPDWAVVGSLPDSRTGMAAFVANLDATCSGNNETGALSLDSPTIVIPAGVQVPRISVEHWFATEFGWDGGNFKISVNGGSFSQIPDSAIEVGSYNATLFPAIKETLEYNSNPLADQAAFTGTDDGQPTGSWGESHINLLGIAAVGDSIRLRLDFGIDECGGDVGWYADNVEFYSCEAELLPSDCGNGDIDQGEQCDDGNDFIGDGCSNTCQIEEGWLCTAPKPAGTVPDSGFEAGTPNPVWTEASNNPIGTPICKVSVCGSGGGIGPSSGTFWAWLGGVTYVQEGSVTQTLVIPPTSSELTFDFASSVCDSPSDYIEVLVDGTQELLIDGSNALCGINTYSSQSVNISTYADGGSHEIQFHSETFANNGGRSDFFVDNVALPRTVSMCRREGTNLTLVKSVINDNQGSEYPAAWTLTASGPSGFSGAGPIVLSGETFDAGSYDLSESGPAGYVASDWVCDGGTQDDADSITLALGEAATCTITNDDISPSITVMKTIINDNGGVIENPNAFGLQVDGDSVLDSVISEFDAGDHTVSEVGLAGYQAGSWGGDCNPDGSIALTIGQAASCTITNDDISATLTVVRTIVNDNGGLVNDPDLFDLKIDGADLLHNIVNQVDAGAHTLSEVGLAGYQSGVWGGDCNPDGSITLSLGEHANCIITSNDISATLTVHKTIINDNGGAVVDKNAFGLRVNTVPVLHAAVNMFDAGNHTVSEDGLAGYLPGTWGGDCNSDGTIVLALDQHATCSITNDDTDSTSLTLVNQVINDSGGNASGSAWTLIATGPTGFSGTGPSVSSGSGFAAGSYDLSESAGTAGYSASDWVCVGGTQSDGDTISLSLGDAATCTITNDDISPTLTVVKTILNDNGGTVTNPNAFGLRVDGGSVQHNATNPFNAGDHSVSEAGLAGYQPGVWGGDCSPGGSITLALAQNATCTITNDDSDSTSLTLIKQVINDSGGSATASQWTLTATGPTSITGPGPNVSSGGGFSAGQYDLSETGGVAGYSASVWVCVGGVQDDIDTITLSLGDAVTCTIINNDMKATLTVVKTIVNDNGGSVSNPNVFGLKVDGGSVLHNAINNFNAGPHLVSEDGSSGYQASDWGGACNPDGSITLALNQNATCTITNNDIQPTLTVVNTIVSDNGGTITDEDAFGLQVDGGDVLHNVSNTFDVGPHNVSEVGLAGYQQGSWSGDCNEDGSIILAPGDTATCIVTNDDISPILTVVKTIINDNGGKVTDKNLFGLKVDDTPVQHGVSNAFNVGAYTVSEVGLSGYQAGSWGGDCDETGNISLTLGQDATCTITNNDITATLKVLKIIISDNGGDVNDPDAFVLRVDGSSVLHDAINLINAGNHTVSEDGLPGYLPGAWGGDCNADGSITLALAQAATCSITNDDSDTTSLTLVKRLINDNGGTASGSDWTLAADGLTPFSGGGPNVSSGEGFAAGTYDLSEIGGPVHYTASDWVCVGGTQNDSDTVTLALGEAAICTITNNDISPTLKVVKIIVSDNGGLVTDPNAFDLRVDGASVLHDVTNQFDAGNHNISEEGLDGYLPGSWGGDCDAAGNITLSLGDIASCSITNDDISATLKVVNTIINNNGGTTTDPDVFSLKVDGGSVLNSAVNTFDVGGHTVSGLGLAGYQASTWGGDCNPDGSINLVLGQEAVCSITNDDISPTITVISTITNDNGGSVSDPDAFGLRVDDGSVLDSNINAYDVGSHIVTADGLTGYQASAWGGDCAADGSVSLVLDQDAICTITQNDISPTLKVVKTIINNNGGAVVDEDGFVLRVDEDVVLNDVINSFDTGEHTVSEDGLPGYLPGTWGGDCDANGKVTLLLGQDATCTITNNDISPTITVVKTIVNDNGGMVLEPNLFGLRVDGGSVLDSVTNAFNAGSHLVSEEGLPGYQASVWGGDCDAAGNITLALDQNAICTITNDDITPTLKVLKTVVNDNGGAITDENAFTLRVDGNLVLHNMGNNFDAGDHVVSEVGLPTYQPGVWGGDCDAIGNVTLTLGETSICTISNDDISPTLTIINNIVNDNGGALTDANAFGLRVNGGSVLDNASNYFDVGNHVVAADGLAGYQASIWSGDCDANGNVTLALNQGATCTITHDDISPTLTLVKSIINDNGGTIIDANAFGLRIDQDSVADRAINAVDAGAHMASEDGLAGYMPGSWGGDCNSDGSVNLILDQDATCTITNDDITATLTVIKTIITDNGGAETNPNVFGLRVDGNAVLHNSPNNYDAGEHMVSEDGLAGYVAQNWGGDCLPDGSIALTLGQDATCTITNDDSNSTSLTLIKAVVNNNGGSASAEQWTLTATGATGFSGTGPSVSNDPEFFAGSYDLSESGGPPGYQSSVWNCLGGTQIDFDTVKLELGETAICTITNDDISPTITVIKTVVNDNGGVITNLNAFGLRVDGNLVSHNANNEFVAGVHLVTEDGLPEYLPGQWGGDCNANGEVTLELAQQATCTITNDDTDSTSLQLIKQVVNDNGGAATPSQWLLTATGPTGFSGNGPSVSNDPDFSAGIYHLSESNGPEGYTTGDWICVGGSQDDADTITLALGEMAVCTIVSDDISPTLKVIKTIVNDHGGIITDADDFGFKVDNENVLHNVTNDFDAGPHTVSEQESSRYKAGPWGGDCNVDGSIILKLAEVAICTITNDDIDFAELIFKSGFENE